MEKDRYHCLTKPSEWFNIHLEHHGANLICSHMSTPIFLLEIHLWNCCPYTYQLFVDEYFSI